METRFSMQNSQHVGFVAAWCGVAAISITQLHSTKPGLRFCAGFNPARGVLEICYGENL